MSKETVHIPVNKKRLTGQVVLFTIIGLGALMGGFMLGEQFDILGYIFQGLGILICLFALIAAGAKLKKRNDSKAGLLIDKKGITDNSSDLSLGFVSWKDIKRIDRDRAVKNDLLIIEVKKQEEYLRKAKNSAIERLLRQNIRQFDTPIVVDPAYLSDNVNLVLDKIDQFKK